MTRYLLKSNKQVNKEIIDSENTLKFCDKVYGNRFQSLLQENLCLNSILDVMANPVAYRDENGQYLFVNRAFEILAGLPAKEIIGHTRIEMSKKICGKAWEKNNTEEDCFLGEWDQIDMGTLRSGGSRTFEQKIVCADGIKRIFLVNVSAFKNEKGRVQGLVTVLQDITELRNSENVLEENYEKYRIVTEQTGQLVYDFDLLTDEGSWTGEIEEVTGYSKEEFQGISRDIWVEHIHPDDRDAVLKEFIETRKKGKATG